MREIKFRAWDKELKFMVDDTMYIMGIGTGNVFFDNQGDLIEQSNKLVLMQYTGLKDKNGKDIYEGDVSKNYYKGQWVNLVVVWNPLGMWSVKWKDGYLNNYHINNQNMEVIGNIYENPELLK